MSASSAFAQPFNEPILAGLLRKNQGGILACHDDSITCTTLRQYLDNDKFAGGTKKYPPPVVIAASDVCSSIVFGPRLTLLTTSGKTWRRSNSKTYRPISWPSWSTTMPVAPPKWRLRSKYGWPRTRTLTLRKVSHAGYVFKCMVVLHVFSYFSDCFCAFVICSVPMLASRVVPHDQRDPLLWPL